MFTQNLDIKFSTCLGVRNILSRQESKWAEMSFSEVDFLSYIYSK